MQTLNTTALPTAIPTLETERLILRAWKFEDCDAVDVLMNDQEVARMTSSVPFPYPPNSAFGFIATQRGKLATGRSFSFAVTQKLDGAVIGSAGVFKRGANAPWELGYWIGRPFWQKGYATEAATCVTNWSYEALSCDTIVAGHFADNPASGKILQKIGFARVSEETVPMYSLTRGGKEPGLMYVWPAAKAAETTLASLH